jgi:hypothetical protein
MNWSAQGNVLNQYLRNTSIGTTVITFDILMIIVDTVSYINRDSSSTGNASQFLHRLILLVLLLLWRKRLTSQIIRLSKHVQYVENCLLSRQSKLW